jgi:hypothetical protein
MANDARTTEPTLTALVSGIINDAQELIRQQFHLLRSEIRQELRQARNAAISMGLGVATAAVGALLLILMVVHVIAAYTPIPPWGSYGIVGGALVAIGGGFLYFGQREAADVELAPPPQTAEALKENLAWLKRQTTPEKT